MTLLGHSNIVKLYEIIQVPEKECVCIVMEYISGGELFDYILSQGKLSEKESAYLFRQIISALAHCHRNLVVHRDLKPENILLDATHKTVKITDFGLSNMMDPGVFLMSKVGSPLYSSPELLAGNKYIGPEVDIWACGVILYAMVSGHMPWLGATLEQQLNNASKAAYVPLHGVSKGCKDLVALMLTADPSKRATVYELLQHPWINQGRRTPSTRQLCPVYEPLAIESIDQEIIKQLQELNFDSEEVVAALRDPSKVHSQAVNLYHLISEKKNKIRDSGSDSDGESGSAEASSDEETQLSSSPTSPTTPRKPRERSDETHASNNNSNTSSMVSSPAASPGTSPKKRRSTPVNSIFKNLFGKNGEETENISDAEVAESFVRTIPSAALSGAPKKRFRCQVDLLQQALEKKLAEFKVDYKVESKIKIGTFRKETGIIYGCKFDNAKFTIEICRLSRATQNESNLAPKVLLFKCKSENTKYSNLWETIENEVLIPNN
jgi:5'-AMP-activated protein kinase catalytic alpha subunit